MPRGHHTSFGPQIVPKGETRFAAFDDMSLSLDVFTRHERGRDSSAPGRDLCRRREPEADFQRGGLVLEEVSAGQIRPLEEV